jgi:hypothetical protein
MMGGEVNDDWDRYPEREAVIICCRLSIIAHPSDVYKKLLGRNASILQ